MAIAEELIIVMRAQVEGALAPISKVDKELTKLKGTAKSTVSETSKMAAGITRSMVRMGIQFVGYKALIEGIKFNAFKEQSTIAFGVMMGNVDQAKDKMKELLDYSLKVPLTFKDTIAASRQLLAYGFSAGELTKQLDMLGNVATALGQPLGEVAYVYGTLRAQGKAYARDLMQFGMRGIPIYEELAKVLKVDVSEISKLTEKGKIGFKEVEMAFKNMTSAGGRFGGIMPAIMQSLTGQFQVFKGVGEIALGDLTKGISDMLVPALKELNMWLIENRKSFQAIGSVLGFVATGLKEVVKAAVILAPLLGIIVAMKLPVILTAIGVALKGIMVALSYVNPWIAGLVTITALLPMIIGLFQKTEKEAVDLEKVFGDFNAVDDWFPGLADTLKISAEDMEKMEKAFDKYLDAYRKYLAERSQNEEGNVTAMVDYEHRKKLEKAREDFKLDDERFKKVKRMLDEQYAYERRLAKETAAYALAMEMRNMFGATNDYGALKQNIDKQASDLGLSGVVADDYKMRKLIVEKAKDQLNLSQILTDNGITQVDLWKKQYDVIVASNGQLTTEEKAFIRKTLQLKAQIPLAEALTNKTSILLESTKDINKKQELTTSLYIRQNNILKQQFNDYTTMAQAQEINNSLIKLELEYKEKMRDLDIERYNIMLNGDEEHWKNLQRQAGQGNLGAAVGTQMQGTDVGKLVAGANPITMIIVEFAKALMSIENVAKVLNFIGTIFASMAKILAPFLNSILQPMVSLFDALGAIIAAVITVFIMMNPIFQIFRIAIEMLADALTWLYNVPIRAFANGLIDIMNGVIKALNKIPFVNIRYIARLEKITSSLEESADALNERLNELNDSIDYLKNKLKDMFNQEIASLQDLYEVGAISAKAYASLAKGLYDEYADYFMSDLDIQYAQLTTMQQVKQAIIDLQKEAGVVQDTTDKITAAKPATDVLQAALTEAKANGANVSSISKAISYALKVAIGGTGLSGTNIDNQITMDLVKQLAALVGYTGDLTTSSGLSQLATLLGASGYFTFATGTSMVPNDMLANIHEGEGIVPKDFMSAIRNGELTLGGPKGGQASGNVYNIVVEGSVIEERNLIRTIVNGIETNGRRGFLPA